MHMVMSVTSFPLLSGCLSYTYIVMCILSCVYFVFCPLKKDRRDIFCVFCSVAIKKLVEEPYIELCAWLEM